MNDVLSAGVVPGDHLHSRYNPRAEAERYIDALNAGGGIEYFILVEPGLGYLIPALQKRYVNSAIIVLHADTRFREAAPESPDIPAWYPDSRETVQQFLESHIPDVSASQVRIIEWRPSLLFYGESCVRLLSEASEFIKRADAGFRTTTAFGLRWTANFFRNIGLIKTALGYKPFTAPVIIAGSGPGLETAVPRMAALKEHAFILAASSAVPALRARGITPDMVISTDGGGWALSHLYACFRDLRLPAHSGLPESPGTVAAAFSAALPSQCTGLPVLVLNDGSLWQSVILCELGIPSVVIPQRGTVTASALELALVLSSGNIYLAGMDLSVKDIRTHARPYGFDYLFEGRASRFLPLYSQHFTRSRAIAQGGSHDVYAAWFKNRLTQWPERIFSLGDTNAVFTTAGELPINTGLPVFSPASHFMNIAVTAAAAERVRRGTGALFRAMDDPRYAKIIRDELGRELFPHDREVPLSAIKDAVKSMVEKYGGRHG